MLSSTQRHALEKIAADAFTRHVLRKATAQAKATGDHSLLSAFRSGKEPIGDVAKKVSPELFKQFFSEKEPSRFFALRNSYMSREPVARKLIRELAQGESKSTNSLLQTLDELRSGQSSLADRLHPDGYGGSTFFVGSKAGRHRESLLNAASKQEMKNVRNSGLHGLPSEYRPLPLPNKDRGKYHVLFRGAEQPIKASDEFAHVTRHPDIAAGYTSLRSLKAGPKETANLRAYRARGLSRAGEVAHDPQDGKSAFADLARRRRANLHVQSYPEDRRPLGTFEDIIKVHPKKVPKVVGEYHVSHRAYKDADGNRQEGAYRIIKGPSLEEFA